MLDYGQDVTQEDLAAMGQAMTNGSGIQLPFAALNLWPHNGTKEFAQFAQQAPVSYFGGWHMDAEKLEQMSGQFPVSLDKLPWRKTELQGDRNTYTVYESRVIHIAPIAFRTSWVGEDRSRKPEYDPSHQRSHTQYLTLIGVKIDNNPVQMLCPAVVTVKGMYQSLAIKTALNDWGKLIHRFKAELKAQNLPPAAFWHSIGTVGNTANFEQTKKGAIVTPVKAVMIPDNPTAEWLAQRFVGGANLAIAVRLMKEAKDWLEAWKKPVASRLPAVDEPPMPEVPEDDFQPSW